MSLDSRVAFSRINGQRRPSEEDMESPTSSSDRDSIVLFEIKSPSTSSDGNSRLLKQRLSWRPRTFVLVAVGVLACLGAGIGLIVYTQREQETGAGDVKGHEPPTPNLANIPAIVETPGKVKSSNDDSKLQENQSLFTFDDIFNQSFRARGFSIRWVPGRDEFTYRNDDGALVLYSAVDDRQTIIMDNSTFQELNTGTYYLSPQLDYVLFAYDIEPLWRYSFTARYKLLRINGSVLTDFPNNGSLTGQRLQYAGWSPTGHALSFVHGNDLYVQELPDASAIRITYNGVENTYFNGITDWLYEEDVLGNYVAHYWSPDGRSLVFATFNVSAVPKIRYPYFGPKTAMYPDIVEIAYPKAGLVENGMPGPNPIVQLYVVENVTEPGSPIERIYSPIQGDHYYTRVAWRDDGQVFIAWVNRVQNESVIMLCAVANVTCQTNAEHIVHGGWLDSPWPRPIFIENGTKYLTILPQAVGTSGTWPHIALVTSPMNSSSDVTFLANGENEVTSIVGYNFVLEMAYYLGTRNDPKEQHLFSVSTSVAVEDRQPICLTCPSNCSYSSASFSQSGRYYLHTCSGPGVATYRLKDMGSKDVLMEGNEALAAALSSKALPTRQFVRLNVGGGYQAEAEVHLPPNHQPGRQYPLLVYVYGGPGSQLVRNVLPFGGTTTNWLRYLGSSENIAVASVDGRGGTARGDKFRFEIYRRLGNIEIYDQIEGARELKNMSYINRNQNAAIFGWSYGGFAAAHALANNANVYQCAVSVAPFTSAAYYDTAYTERYMALATPSDNAIGYEATDISEKVSLMQNKTFMLVHGTADDNVHFQNSAQLTKALVEAQIQFRNLIYIDDNHGINGPGSSRHLYKAMSDFLLSQCWKFV